MHSKESQHWDFWNEKYRTGDLKQDRLFTATRNAVVRELERFKIMRGRIIEVACGTGRIGQILAGKYFYVGVDLSPAAIEIARQNIPQATFVNADFLQWKAGESFENALFIDAIACFRDQPLAMQKVNALLPEGGNLILTTINPFVYKRMSWIGPPAEGQARNWLSGRKLHQLLRESHFRIQRSYTIVPLGDSGVLRWINAGKINRLLSYLIPASWITRFKETIGLGAVRVVVAQKIPLYRDPTSIDSKP